MNQYIRTRKLLFCVALVSVFATGCSRSCRSGGMDMQEMLQFIPADVSGWAEIDVRRGSQTELGKQLLAKIEEDASLQKELERWKTTCGFNPLKQIHKVFAGVPSESDVLKLQSALIVVIQGEFEEDAIRKCLDVAAQESQTKLVETKYGRYRAYEVSIQGKRSSFVLPTGKNWMMISSRNRLVEALALPDKQGASLRDNKAFLEAIQRPRSADVVIWGLGLISTESAKQVNTKYRERLEKLIPGVDLAGLKEFNLALALSQTLSFRFVINVGSKDQSQKIANAINELLNDLKKDLQRQKSQYADFLSAIKLYDANETIVLEIPFTEEDVKKAVDLAIGEVKENTSDQAKEDTK